MECNIKIIKEILETTPTKDLNQKLDLYKNDSRTGVQKLITLYTKKYDKYLKEITRVKTLNTFEDHYYNTGLSVIAGTDEVGRGCLAGPVFACVVILPKDSFFYGINDSKLISKKNRELLSDEIKKNAIDYKLGIVSSKRIDEINILNATIEAMNIAIDNLKIKPDILLVDSIKLNNLEIPQHSIIKGDTKSISIAAASIVAKVARDKLMAEYSKIYSNYDFENNMGYGTEKHLKALKEYGASSIHRKTFIKNLDVLQTD